MAKNARSSQQIRCLRHTRDRAASSKAMSRSLDEHRDLFGFVAGDLVLVGVKATARRGLPAEAVSRCALVSSPGTDHQEPGVRSRGVSLFRALPACRGHGARRVALERRSARSGRDLQQMNRTCVGRAGRRSRGRRSCAGQHCDFGTDARAEWQQPVAGYGPDMVRRPKQADALMGGTGLACYDRSPRSQKRARKIQSTAVDPSVELYRAPTAIIRTTLAYLEQRRRWPWRASPHHSGRPGWSLSAVIEPSSDKASGGSAGSR